MLATSVTLLSSWTDVTDASASEASEAFERVRRRFGGVKPLLAIDENGRVQLTRQIDPLQSYELETLHLLSFDPAHGKLADVAFPYWFVRMKLSDTMNLGTMVSIMAQDWQGMDLRVTEEDLEALGPTLLLEQSLAGGARIMLWTE